LWLCLMHADRYSKRCLSTYTIKRWLAQFGTRVRYTKHAAKAEMHIRSVQTSMNKLVRILLDHLEIQVAIWHTQYLVDFLSSYCIEAGILTGVNWQRFRCSIKGPFEPGL